MYKRGREPQLAENPGRGQRTIVKERGEETVSRMGRVGDGYCSIQGGGNYELQLAENSGVGQRMIVKVLNYPPVYQLYPFYYSTLLKMFIQRHVKKILITHSYCEIDLDYT